MSDTVTVTTTQQRGRKTGLPRFTVQFSALPDRTFGPWDFTRTTRDLTVSALLSPMDARNLVLDAHTNGSATTEVDH